MKIGLALSGGGARGYSHLGAVKAFQEHGIEPAVISGSSAGAVAGAFLAAGYKPDQVMEIFSEVNFLKYLRPAIASSGLVKIEKLTSWLLEFFPDNNFESLKLPLTIATTNYTKGITEYFTTGELIKPMLASASLPVIFAPITMNGDIYFDGGILNNMPAQQIRDQADFIIGINCNYLKKNAASGGMKDMLERCLLMAISPNTYAQKQYCDLFMEPDQLGDYRVFSLSKAKEIYAIGYEFALQELTNAPELLKKMAESR
ncbi:patatin-like phospholipase family protein [Marivirga sp. S37H4]|uniref:Patatin-like phospholipase family protein n=1 Tax=Marivirga aurantiaca TaxID=2802615 RepID=A0A935CBM2_9BACT|nr:patatin-like phospholipase family protein [Marivirga aurantiaca]MBK6267401.1 patatin-like phospholipase family protein [Marivirga aurantiaca]